MRLFVPYTYVHEITGAGGGGGSILFSASKHQQCQRSMHSISVSHTKLKTQANPWPCPPTQNPVFEFSIQGRDGCLLYTTKTERCVRTHADLRTQNG